jgi:hypothetical protein
VYRHSPVLSSQRRRPPGATRERGRQRERPPHPPRRRPRDQLSQGRPHRPARPHPRPGQRGLPRAPALPGLGRNRPAGLVGRDRQRGRPSQHHSRPDRRDRIVRADARRRALHRQHHARASRRPVVRHPLRSRARPLPAPPDACAGPPRQPHHRRHGRTPPRLAASKRTRCARPGSVGTATQRLGSGPADRTSRRRTQRRVRHPALRRVDARLGRHGHRRPRDQPQPAGADPAPLRRRRRHPHPNGRG